MPDMSSEDCRGNTSATSGNIDKTRNSSGRRMSHFKEYKFFRSFSAKVENWPMRKAEALWRRMRERKIAGRRLHSRDFQSLFNSCAISKDSNPNPNEQTGIASRILADCA